MRKTLFLFLLALVFSLPGVSQNQRKIDSLVRLVSTAADTEQVSLYNDIGIEYWYLDVAKSEAALAKAIALSKKIHFTRGEARACNNLAVAAWIRSDYKRAAQLYDSSAALWQQMGLSVKMYEVLDNLALLYSSTGEWEKSLKLYLANLKRWEKAGNRAKIATSNANLGKLYQTLGRDTDAVRYYHKAYMLFTGLHDETGTAESAIGLSSHYRHVKEYDKALSYAFIALEKSLRQNDLRRIAFSYQLIGNLYFDEEKYNLALTYYQKQLALVRQSADVAQEAIVLNNIGKSYGKTGESGKSETALFAALQKAREIHDIILISEIYSDLSQCLADLKDYKKSLYYFEKSKNLKDSIYSQEMISNFNEIQVKYETEKKNNEILALQGKVQKSRFDIQVKENDARVAKLIYSITILSLLFIFYTLYRFIRYKNRIRHLKANEMINDLRLKMLLLQINPHFYFNTLNNIYGQMLEDNSSPKSRELILRLSELMRFLVENADKKFISLPQCIEFIEDYLIFEKERFGNRCNLVFEKKLDSQEGKIAHYVVFPLIENAFKYGTNKIEPFTIRIDLRLEEGVFTLLVKNEITRPPAGQTGTGKGLSTLQKCLEMLYPGRHQLKINKTKTEHGVNLSIRI